MKLHENRELFEQTILYTADQLGIEPAIVEKDYYVTMVLKALVDCQPGLIFKGGTSLSKCYKLIKRFSEDIDLNIEGEKATEGMKRHLKENVLAAVDSVNLQVVNLENIRSRRDFNRYEISYDSLFGRNIIDSAVYVETAVYIHSFPTVQLEASSYIGDFLVAGGYSDIISEYGLEPYAVRVLSAERTFIDKVFAICDYYLSGKLEKHSRHLYDLMKLLPLIKFDENFKELVEEVREVRKPHKTCLSAQDAVDLKILLRTIIDEDVYKTDYEKVTTSLLFEEVDYKDAINALRIILDSGMF